MKKNEEIREKYVRNNMKKYIKNMKKYIANMKKYLANMKKSRENMKKCEEFFGEISHYIGWIKIISPLPMRANGKLVTLFWFIRDFKKFQPLPLTYS